MSFGQLFGGKLVTLRAELAALIQTIIRFNFEPQAAKAKPRCKWPQPHSGEAGREPNKYLW